MYDQVQQIIGSIMKKRFPDAEIVSIDIQADADYDDDSVLNVQVVFRNRSGHLDANKASRLIGEIIPRLQEEGEKRFPVMSFVSSADLMAG